VFTNVTFAGTSFAGGAGTDVFSGTIAGVGAGGVSFWGGTGSDTFNFTQISTNYPNGASDTFYTTAYFWNDSGADSLVFGSIVSASSGSANIRFGVSEGTSSTISFLGSQSLANNAYSNIFGTASDLTASFVSVGVGDGTGNLVTLTFGNSAVAGGFTNGFGSYILAGTLVETITQALSGYSATTGTANWGGNISIPTFS